MLILMRRVGEEIYIAKGRIKISILSEKDGVFTLGIQAPRAIDIDRKEVFVRKEIKRCQKIKEAQS